jgi:hypothetical protein
MRKSFIIAGLCLVIALAAFALSKVSYKIATYHFETEAQISGLTTDAENVFSASEKAHSLLGDSLRVDGPIKKNLKLVDDGGTAQLNIPVSGDRRKGLLDVQATEEAGRWTINRLALQPAGESVWTDLPNGSVRP